MKPDARKRNYGCLTPLMREHLQTRNKTEPIDEKERDNRKQSDFVITRHAKQALKDLALVAAAYPEKRTQDIFSIDDLTTLVSAIIFKNGSDVTNHGPYYHVLIDAIIAEMNSSPNGEITHLKFHIEPQLYGSKSGRPLDLTNTLTKRISDPVKK